MLECGDSDFTTIPYFYVRGKIRNFGNETIYFMQFSFTFYKRRISARTRCTFGYFCRTFIYFLFNIEKENIWVEKRTKNIYVGGTHPTVLRTNEWLENIHHTRTHACAFDIRVFMTCILVDVRQFQSISYPRVRIISNWKWRGGERKKKFLGRLTLLTSFCHHKNGREVL